VTQRLSDKCEAIISLLALVFWHLELIPGAMKVQRYGESDGTSDAKPPTPYNLNCKGLCRDCWEDHRAIGKKPACPPEVTWVRVHDGLRRQYRIADVEAALIALRDANVSMAQAVWAVYVEPWPEPRTEPIGHEAREHRARLADEGIVWLAHEIRGPVIAFGLSKREQVEEMLRSGVTSTAAIVRAVGCDRRYVKRLKHTQVVRPRQTVDAVS
jgi:hypothetical protein